MSTLELDRLEADVALARERVAADVARLRSPAAVAGFKEDIGHTLSETAHRAATDLKNRAAANPAAVLAIAAGLLWRFARHPPIASILVGVGLASLMRTSADSPPSPVVTRTGELFDAASEKASELNEQAREFAGQAREFAGQVRETAAAAAARVSETTGRLAEQATQAAARVSDQVSATASQFSEQGARLSDDAREGAGRFSEHAGEAAAQAERAAAWTSQQAAHFADQAARSTNRARAAAQRMFADGSARDGFLLAAAAFAVGAAAYLAHRRDDDA